MAFSIEAQESTTLNHSLRLTLMDSPRQSTRKKTDICQYLPVQAR